jgi:hypothetical protein
MTGRRFPPPWSIDDIGACFVVKDSNGVGTDTERFSEMTF